MIIFDKLVTERQEILDKIFSSESLLLTYFNQHCFNIYFKDKRYKELLDKDFIVYAEGIGMNLFFKLILKKKIKRIDATFLFDLVNKIINHSESIFLVGGNFNKKELNKILLEKGSNLLGYQKGFFNGIEKNFVINKINDTKAKFILIGMGVPRQEYFAYELSKTTNDKIIICVGNFLEFYFGTIKRSPLIFQKLGLEWLFRLATEPGRLWKRYVFGIPKFIFRAIQIKRGRLH